MQRISLLLTVFVLAASVTIAVDREGRAAERDETSVAATSDGSDMVESFVSPPNVCRPWVYWWWLNANVTKESITRDLEAMASQGVGGFLLFDVTAYGHHLVPAPERRVGFMTPRWRHLVHHAMSEAGRLGLRMSMNLSTCGGALQTPWDMGENAPKQLLWTSTEVRGPAQIDCRLRPPGSKHFWDVAILAARHAETADAPAAEAGHAGAGRRSEAVGSLGAPAFHPAEGCSRGDRGRGPGVEARCPGAAGMERARRPMDVDPPRL